MVEIGYTCPSGFEKFFFGTFPTIQNHFKYRFIKNFNLHLSLKNAQTTGPPLSKQLLKDKYQVTRGL